VSFDNARENNNKLVDTINLQNSKANSTANNRTVVLALKAMKTADNSTLVAQRSLKTNTNLMKTEMVEPNTNLMKTELVEPDTNLNAAGSRTSNLTTCGEDVAGGVVLKVRFKLVRNHQIETRYSQT
jgi:hypothetical protein